jgi:hypothetical protein
MRMREIFYSSLTRLCHLNFHSTHLDGYFWCLLLKTTDIKNILYFFVSVVLNNRHKKYVFFVLVT